MKESADLSEEPRAHQKGNSPKFLLTKCSRKHVDRGGSRAPLKKGARKAHAFLQADTHTNTHTHAELTAHMLQAFQDPTIKTNNQYFKG